MANRLTKLELDEISLVDKGMNPKTKVVLAKRAGVVVKVTDVFKKMFAGEKITVEKELLDPSKQLDEFIAKLPEADQAILSALIAAVAAKGGGAPAPVKTEEPKKEEPKAPEGAAPMKPDEVAKAFASASPEAVQVFKSLIERAEKTDKALELVTKTLAEQNAKVRKAESIEKASKLKAIPGTSVEKMAETIQKAMDGDGVAVTELVSLLEKAAETAGRNLPMAQRGNSGANAPSGSAAEELETLVQKRLSEVSKSADGKKYTYQQAYMDVSEAHPGLIDRISEERRAS